MNKIPLIRVIMVYLTIYFVLWFGDNIHVEKKRFFLTPDILKSEVQNEFFTYCKE